MKTLNINPVGNHMYLLKVDQLERRPEVSRTDTRYKSRYIYQRPGSSTELAQYTRNNRMNPIKTSNRFEGLSEYEPSTPIMNDPIKQITFSRKQRAVSPLEANYTRSSIVKVTLYINRITSQ